MLCVRATIFKFKNVYFIVCNYVLYTRKGCAVGLFVMENCMQWGFVHSKSLYNETTSVHVKETMCLDSVNSDTEVCVIRQSTKLRDRI